MLAHVNAELSKERNEVRAGDLRVLKMKIEKAIALAPKQSAPTIAECAPPGVTIH